MTPIKQEKTIKLCLEPLFIMYKRYSFEI